MAPFGQEPPHRMGLDVRLILDLTPYGELARVVGAEREGGHDLERELPGPEFIEQLGHHVCRA